MTAIKLDGLATAKAIKAELAERVIHLKQKGITPGLGTLLVGDDPGSHSYVGGKHRDCAEVGIHSIRIDLPQSASSADVRAAIRDLNSAKDVTGYIVQLPLPFGIDTNEMLELIDPDKDADGLHPTNLGRLVLGVSGELTSPLPCTPAGIVELLNRYDITTRGAEVAVIGRGVTVGIIDSGIDPNSHEFSGQIHAQSGDVTGADRPLGDDDGHGTSVSRVLAAAKDDRDVHGMAFNATILALRADQAGSCTSADAGVDEAGCSFFDSTIAAGVDRASSRGILSCRGTGGTA